MIETQNRGDNQAHHEHIQGLLEAQSEQFNLKII